MGMMLAGLAMLAGIGGDGVPVTSAVEEPVETVQLVIHRRIIIRIPTHASSSAPAAPQSEWKEAKGPKCLALDSVRGAAVVHEDSVDLILAGGVRLRAQFARSCPELDYYSGFYILPGADGRVCADRDSVHARSGGECEITRFRTLVPAKR